MPNCGMPMIHLICLAPRHSSEFEFSRKRGVAQPPVAQ